jgi:hypothetical protein
MIKKNNLILVLFEQNERLSVWEIKTFEFIICFEFRASFFGFIHF